MNRSGELGNFLAAEHPEQAAYFVVHVFRALDHMADLLAEQLPVTSAKPVNAHLDGDFAQAQDLGIRGKVCGAHLAASLRGVAFDLPDDAFRLLSQACARHTTGRHHEDVTVQTCSDADRLDLGRVGIKPDPAYLCTEVAQKPEVIAWAHERAVQNYIPPIVIREWHVPNLT